MALPAPGVAATPNNQHEGPRAYHALDAWRGLASLWVVLYHASLSLLAAFPGQSFRLPGWLQGGYLGVPLFFVISGYCIANAAVSTAGRGRGAKAFLLARLRRIYPPYLSVLLLSAAVTLVLHKTFAPPGVSPLFVVSSLTLTQLPLHQPLALAVFWTLNFEVAFYVLVGALLLVPARLRTGRFLLNGLHALTILATALLIFLPRAPWYPLSFWTQFGLGVLAFDILRHPLLRAPRLALVLTGIGLLIFAMTHAYGNPFVLDAPPMRIGFLVSLGFALLLIACYRFDISASRLLLVRLLAWLGGFSYSLYLIHPLTIGAVLFLSHALRLPPRLAPFLVIGEVLLSLACARLLFLCCERPFLSMRKPADTRPPKALADAKGLSL